MIIKKIVLISMVMIFTQQVIARQKGPLGDINERLDELSFQIESLQMTMDKIKATVDGMAGFLPAAAATSNKITGFQWKCPLNCTSEPNSRVTYVCSDNGNQNTGLTQATLACEKWISDIYPAGSCSLNGTPIALTEPTCGDIYEVFDPLPLE